jgi:RNA polymerase sigma-70 factor (ECF subfamily)
LAVVSGLTLKQQSNRNASSTLSATVSDEELVAQYRDSRADSALEELIKRHVPKVRAMIFQMVLDNHAADDLTQETLLRAVRAIDAFEGRSQFGTWLFRIAMNTTHGFLDRRNRSPVVFQAELADRGSCDVTPDVAATDAELRAQIETAIATLSPKLRAAIVLTALQGLSPREAATIEECGESTMHSRVYEARQQLKHKLRDYLS